MANRLASESSLYLQQHAHNPVEWYPWGEEALGRARSEDRPILLSVGYSACHWCHVMERESFENPEIAALMNERFVNIKVDREERPDIDQVYMAAVQAMTGQGGWPMTVFLTPDGRPYFGGTYFPPDDRYGRPGFTRVLIGASDAYRQHKAEVEANAEQILTHTRPVERGAGALLADLPLRATEGLAQAFDRQHGGFGRAPKFPQAMALEFALQRLRAQPAGGAADRLTEIVTGSLDQMAAGGIFDHLAGGFHRYSTDDEWLVPHFEKMLYDNALLARLYLEAGQALGCSRWVTVGRRTLDWAIHEMRHSQGGFFSALDADSEGEEGKFYTWTFTEALELLGSGGEAFMRFYDLTPDGNWEGHSILRHEPGVAPPADFEPLRIKLLAERNRRVRPGLDDKIIASWNGLMLEALATATALLEGSPATPQADYRSVAVSLGAFLLDELWQDGILMRIWRNGRASVPGFLEDYANVARGLLALYEATFEERWFIAARELADAAIIQFWDPDDKRFGDAGTQNERLITRSREAFDNATPAGNSVLASVLLRLHYLTGERRYDDLARQALADVAELAGRYPTGFGRALCAMDFALADVIEVAIAGSPEDPATTALVHAVRDNPRPYKVLAVSPGDSVIALLHGRTLVDGRPAAYVCRNFSCQAAVTRPEDLAPLLGWNLLPPAAPAVT